MISPRKLRLESNKDTKTMNLQKLLNDLPKNSKSHNSIKRLIEVDNMLALTDKAKITEWTCLVSERQILVSVLRAAGFEIEHRKI